VERVSASIRGQRDVGAAKRRPNWARARRNPSENAVLPLPAPHQPPGEVCSCRNAAIWFVLDPSARAMAAADGNRTILGASSPAATFADRYLAAACEHALTIASHSAGVATSSSTMSDSPVASRPAAPCFLSGSVQPFTGPSGSTAACALSMGTSRHAERRPPLLLPLLSAPSQYLCMYQSLPLFLPMATAASGWGRWNDDAGAASLQPYDSAAPRVTSRMRVRSILLVTTRPGRGEHCR